MDRVVALLKPPSITVLHYCTMLQPWKDITRKKQCCTNLYFAPGKVTPK